MTKLQEKKNKTKEVISNDRKIYLKKIKLRRGEILITQISIVVLFIAIWEILARVGKIDSFITSQPSRILNTFMNLYSNGLLKHIGVTCFETIVGFILGTIIGIIIVLALPGVQQLQARNRNKKFETYADRMEDAGKLYIDSYSNDLLGISYLKAILKSQFNIEAITIQRTNNYHDISNNDSIVSANLSFIILKALLSNLSSVILGLNISSKRKSSAS